MKYGTVLVIGDIWWPGAREKENKGKFRAHWGVVSRLDCLKLSTQIRLNFSFGARPGSVVFLKLLMNAHELSTVSWGVLSLK